MATVQIPGGFGVAESVLTLDGDPEPMIVTIGVGGAILDTDAEQVADDVLGWLSAGLAPFQSEDYTWERCEVRYHLSTEAPEDPLHVAVSSIGPFSGEVVNIPIPQNTAVLFHKRTSLGGRQFRGRFYLPGVAAEAIGGRGQILAGDTLTGLQTWAAGAVAAFNAVSAAELYLLHSDPAGLPGAPAPTLISALQVDPIVATQRRRLRP